MLSSALYLFWRVPPFPFMWRAKTSSLFSLKEIYEYIWLVSLINPVVFDLIRINDLKSGQQKLKQYFHSLNIELSCGSDHTLYRDIHKALI